MVYFHGTWGEIDDDDIIEAFEDKIEDDDEMVIQIYYAKITDNAKSVNLKNH